MCPIDSMKVVAQLTEAGVPERQAKAHASVLGEILRAQEIHIMAQVCSKDDLTSALAPVLSRLSALETRVTALEVTVPAAIAESAAKLKSELITWMIALGLLQGGLLTGLVLVLVPAVL